jgi:UDP:flavonoid glycosyltransferase YjiC (YdhE family)
MARSSSVVVFSPGGSHVTRLLPLVGALARRGLTIHVMTRASARGAVQAAGGVFFDLFGRFPDEAADAQSIPFPCRLVTFAAVYAEALTDAVAALRPRLIVYDSFMVVAPLVAGRLGVPHGGLRATHGVPPPRAMAVARAQPHGAIAPACAAAVERLRHEHGMPDASPFSYLDGVSRYLNLYPEPEPFLDDGSRRSFEPIAFFGCLDSSTSAATAPRDADRLRVYLAFGTVIWRYYEAAAFDAIAAIAGALAGGRTDLVVALGRHQPDAGRARSLAWPHVRVEPYADQAHELARADLFVTHHGLNSTHEAIFARVPMLSCPFFGDQPALARRCQELGLAAGLTDAPGAPLEASMIQRAVAAVQENRAVFDARLHDARRSELETIDGREAVVDRILGV